VSSPSAPDLLALHGVRLLGFADSRRIAGYVGLRAALARVDGGERAWVDGPDRASCSLVWIQLHEDLLATLGMERGTDDPG
jgi:hypothetical protein